MNKPQTASANKSAILERPTVRKMRQALNEAGLADSAQLLDQTARSAQDAANALGAPLGAIVKSLLFLVEERAVLALVAGDRQCDTQALPDILNLSGKAKRADAEAVKYWTGFSIGGVAPIAHPNPIPTAIDDSLFRFETVYAAAGHPYCIFAISPDKLLSVTKGMRSDQLSR